MLPKFKFFKSHPGTWRVDGAGKLTMNNNRPQVTICFSSVDQDSNTRFLQKRLPLSALMLFPRGSIWDNGKRIANSNLNTERFTIETSHFRDRSLREELRIDLGNGGCADVSIIPASGFNFGGSKGNYLFLRDARYKIFKPQDKGVTYLIIPDAEIFRFYYGVSSRLCNSIFMGETEKYVDWNLSERGVNPKLFLKTRLSRLERYVFLRSLSDDFAKKNLEDIRKHIKYKSVQGDQVFINTNIPFQGKTTLTVIGKRICLSQGSSNSPAIHAFLAMQLLSCSYTPSFYDPMIIYGGTEYGSGKEGASYSAGTAFDDLDYSDDLEEFLELDHIEGDARIKKLSLLAPSNRFPAMEGLKYSFLKPDGSVDSYGPKFDADEKSHFNTIAELGYSGEGSGGRGVGIYASEQRTSRDMDNFIDMIKIVREINKSKGWEIDFLSNTDELNSNGERLSIFPNIGKKYKWYLINPSSSDKRPRHVAWVQVTLPDNEIMYVVEIELRPDEYGWSTAIWAPNVEGDFFTSADLNLLLKLTGIRHRWPKDGHKWSNSELDERSTELFARSKIHRVSHPQNILNDTDTNENLRKWAEQLTEKINEIKDGLVAF